MNRNGHNSPLGVGGAMIFAAGLGTRFKPWTDKHPKALALVNGKTLLQRNIEYLQQYGIKDIIVNAHHFAEQITTALEKNKGWGSNIVISDETTEVLETGGGLLKAKDLFKPGEKFITCNVDILTDLDISKLLAFHEQKKALISFGVTNRKTSRYLLFDENSRLCGWRNVRTGEEKVSIPAPPGDGQGARFEKAYSCVAVFEYDIFSLIPFTGKFSLIDVYLALAANHPIFGYDHSGGQFVDVGNPESIAIAESIFR
jgi:N-acetyl-alpha-D-muramate 1-phosphate uridylyltransferase